MSASVIETTSARLDVLRRLGGVECLNARLDALWRLGGVECSNTRLDALCRDKESHDSERQEKYEIVVESSTNGGTKKRKILCRQGGNSDDQTVTRKRYLYSRYVALHIDYYDSSCLAAVYRLLLIVRRSNCHQKKVPL